MNQILYLATTNKNKVKEISGFIQTFLKDSLLFIPGQVENPRFIEGKTHKNLRPSRYKPEPLLVLKSLRDIPKYRSPEENGGSFRKNANIKSKALLRYLRERDKVKNLFGVLSEDSGLEVLALKGAPGVFSARYGGPKSGEKKNNRLLLRNMENHRNRQARYVCALSFLFLKDGEAILKNWTAYCEGRLALQEKGREGFGYDPLFIPKGKRKTFGELPAGFKRTISHRALALHKWRSYLLSLIQEDRF